MSEYIEQTTNFLSDGGEILQFEIDDAVYGIEISCLFDIF